MDWNCSFETVQSTMKDKTRPDRVHSVAFPRVTRLTMMPLNSPPMLLNLKKGVVLMSVTGLGLQSRLDVCGQFGQSRSAPILNKHNPIDQAAAFPHTDRKYCKTAKKEKKDEEI